MKKAKKEEPVPDSTTEEKIKEAARVVFTRKGFAAARTRDIADEAGINLALLNYYFRSKEKLFDLIMMENIQRFIVGAKEILADGDSTIKDKTEKVASRYIDMLLLNPDLPLFILSELRANPDQLVDKMGVKNFIMKSSYFQQMKTVALANKIHPLHYFMNTLAMIIFPFVASPIIMNIGNLKQPEFAALMLERKKLIAKWVEAMIKAK